jgi:hypothetical protein
VEYMCQVISDRINKHLEEVLDIAQTYMEHFGLSEANDTLINMTNFQAATNHSAYLHNYINHQSEDETHKASFLFE